MGILLCTAGTATLSSVGWGLKDQGLAALATELATGFDRAVSAWLFGPAVRMGRTVGRLGLLALERLPELALGVVL